VAGAVALLGLATYGWSLAATTGGSNDGDSPKSLPQPSVVAATGKCVVSYAVRSDDGSRFRATVTVANRDNTAIKNWNLLFVMQGSQVVSGNGKVTLDQQGNMVTVTSSQMLSAQKAVTLDIAGRYKDANPAPMAFKLGDRSCETYVSPKPGEPSRPVQRLSNGEVRLGPAIKTPQPGLAIGPGGVVVPVPVPSGTAGVDPIATTTTDPTVGATTPAASVTPSSTPPAPSPNNPSPSASATTSDPTTAPSSPTTPSPEPEQTTDPEDPQTGGGLNPVLDPP
jgi:serine/threonine-protein kinase